SRSPPDKNCALRRPLRTGLEAINKHSTPFACGQVFLPKSTYGTALNKIFTSSRIDQLFMYSRSCSTILSKSWVLPDTIQRETDPGFTAFLCFCHSLSCSYSNTCVGRGPTRLMSPFRTLHNCGSSSRLKRLRTRPMGVTRGSFFILKNTPVISSFSRSCSLTLSAPSNIVRNLYPTKGCPPLPITFQRKKTGPGEVSF